MDKNVAQALEVMDAQWPGYLTAKQVIRARLVELEAEVERLQAIEKERWDVVATRNAAVMRAERAEALLRECLTAMELHPATHERITAHLSENSRAL